MARRKKFLQSRMVSAFLGLVAGLFFGYMIALRNAAETTGDFALIMAITSVVLVTLGFLLPRFTEILIAGVTIFFLGNALWDYLAEKVFGTRRAILTIGAALLLWLDVSIGRITMRDIKKMFRRQLGSK